MSEEAIKQHVAKVAAGAVPFLVHMTVSSDLSWDQWLNLTASEDEGRSEYVALHDALYEGELQRYLRSDIPYFPHIGLGHFVTEDSNYSLKSPEAAPINNERYEAARAEIERLGLGCRYTASAIDLISINDDFTETHSLAQFALGVATA